MTKVPPEIMNHLRALNDVGSSAIEHAHHSPRTQAPIDVPPEHPEGQTRLETRKRHITELFYSALRGIRGDNDGTTTT